MSNGRLTFAIGGREALPVRAIPYVAGWPPYSPDIVAEGFARVKPAAPFPAFLQGLIAYTLSGDTPVEVKPREWDRVIVAVRAYQEELREQRPDILIEDDHIGYNEWRKNAASCLPAGVFVWLDELERECSGVGRHEMASVTRDCDDALILAPIECNDAQTRAMVLDGFARRMHESNDPKVEATRHKELLAWHDHSMKAAMWWKRASVKPHEAAMLLCRIEPLSDVDPERTYVDDDRASPDRYRVLRRVFEDEAEIDPKARTLLDWRDVARREGLPYHGWIDEYEQALPESAVTVSDERAEKVGSGGTTKPEWTQQAWDIGEAWMLAEEIRTGTRPTVEQIARHLEGDLSTLNIKGGRGRFLDWETIKREALTGITGRGKGDNFRNAKGNPQRKKSPPIVKA